MKNLTNRRRVIAGLAASTIAAGSTAGAAPVPTGATPETLDAMQTFHALRHSFDKSPSQGEAADQGRFAALQEAEKAFLTSPTITCEDVALKLEYTLAESLEGYETGATLERLEFAMLRDMVTALRKMQGEG